MARPKAYLFGDSHSYAVERAAERRAAKRLPMPISIHRQRKEKGAVTIGDTSLEEFLELIRPLKEGDLVLSMIGGNQHAVFSTVQHPQPFDFLEPHETLDSLAPGAEVVPMRILSGLFGKGIRGRDGQSLKQLREATSARIVHILPPPPKRDNEFIRQYHESKFAQEDIASLGVSRPELRMKFWRLQSHLLEALCAELGLEIMKPPEQALDQDGYLDRAFYANDATHANADYGELLLAAAEDRYLKKVKDAA